jgi:hypothetical protein
LDHQFEGTSVWVRDVPGHLNWDPTVVARDAAVGAYVDPVMTHLANIAARPRGANFFNDLARSASDRSSCSTASMS